MKFADFLADVRAAFPHIAPADVDALTAYVLKKSDLHVNAAGDIYSPVPPQPGPNRGHYSVPAMNPTRYGGKRRR